MSEQVQMTVSETLRCHKCHGFLVCDPLPEARYVVACAKCADEARRTALIEGVRAGWAQAGELALPAIVGRLL